MAVTLQDIADRAGVTRMTVSLVLNSRQYHRVSPETRRRVEQIARELRYQPNQAARQLTGKRSGIIGLLLPRNAPDYTLRRLEAIDAATFASGHRLMAGHVSPDDDSLDAYLNDFQTRSVEGLIWLGHLNFRPQIGRDVAQRFDAVVFIGQPAPPGTCCVHLDYRGGVRQAVAHLLETGRRRLGLVLLSFDWVGDRDREEGFLEQTARGGLGSADARVWRVGREEARDEAATAAVMQRAVAELVVEGGADALIAPNDVAAAAAIKAVRASGRRVPEDVAVIGQNNSALARHFDPPITSLDLQPEVMADLAIKAMMQLIEGTPGEVPTSLQSIASPLQLIRRDSTRAKS